MTKYLSFQSSVHTHSALRIEWRCAEDLQGFIYLRSMY